MLDELHEIRNNQPPPYQEADERGQLTALDCTRWVKSEAKGGKGACISTPILFIYLLLRF